VVNPVNEAEERRKDEGERKKESTKHNTLCRRRKVNGKVLSGHAMTTRARIHTHIIIIIIIFSGSAAQHELWLPRSRGYVITYNDAPQSAGLVWTSDQLFAETLPDNTQHTQQTNIHAAGGIQTHDCSRRTAVDLRLRRAATGTGYIHTCIRSICVCMYVCVSMCVCV
jgi:hypothetical protein